MRLEEIVSKMSKLYLGRLIDSFLKDVTKDSEEKMRELILKNKDELVNYDRIKNKLDFIEEDRNTRLLNNLILNALLNENRYILKEKELIETIKSKEEEILEESEKEDCLKYSDPKSLQIYEKVLNAAWKWKDSISPHEQNILDVLKKELNLSVYEHRILESRLGYFPQINNKIHGIKRIKGSLKDLQYRGLVARIRDDDCYYVIPQEIAEKMRVILGVELSKNSYLLLLKKLKKTQLKEILRENRLPIYGKKKSCIKEYYKQELSLLKH